MFQSHSQEITNIVVGLEQAHAPCSRVNLHMFQAYKQYLHAWHIHMYMHHCMYTCTHAMFMICALAFYR